MQPDNLYQNLVRNFEHIPTLDQRIALKMLSSFVFNKEIKIFILKGFAGTGKTTIMRTFIENLNLINWKFSLLAPTGRAAKILTKYTQKKAYTIHRKIYFYSFDDTGVYKPRLKINKNKNVVFVIDEASLISENESKQDFFTKKSMLDDIVEHVDFNTNSKIILLGDPAQLPPVKLTFSPALDKEFLENKFNTKVHQNVMTKVVRQKKKIWNFRKCN